MIPVTWHGLIHISHSACHHVILNSSMIMGILPNGELRSHKTYHFYPGLCNPTWRNWFTLATSKHDPVLHSNSNLSQMFVLEPPAFLELSDTANVRFQDVFLKFWSNFYHLKLLTVANIWQIPTKANVNFPFDPSIPMVKLSSLHQSLIFFDGSSNLRTTFHWTWRHRRCNLTGHQVTGRLPMTGEAQAARNSPRPQALSRIPSR